MLRPATVAGSELCAFALDIGRLMGPFADSQVWVYKTRDGESASRIVICRVESDAKLGEVIHIHVNGLHFKNRRAPGGYSDAIGHMPFSADALRSSVSALESVNVVLPSFEDGYNE